MARIKSKMFRLNIVLSIGLASPVLSAGTENEPMNSVGQAGSRSDSRSEQPRVRVRKETGSLQQGGTKMLISDAANTNSRDRDVVDAFRLYWDSFDQYEDKIKKEGKVKYRRALHNLKEAYLKKSTVQHLAQLKILRSSAHRYRRQLEKFADASNRPYVMLNLAQVLNQIGDLQKIGNTNSSENTAIDGAKHEALAILESVGKEFPKFQKRESALYLKAVIFESLGEAGHAQAVWQILARLANSSIYGVHALIAVGDHYFKLERSDIALSKYRRALKLLGKIQTKKTAYEKLRLHYRISWAAYRAADLATVIKFASKLLAPGQALNNAAQRKLIQSDAVELIGDALYEQNDFSRTKKVLTSKSMIGFGARIGMRTMLRYGGSEIYGEAVRVGEFVADEYSLALEIPIILEQLALLYQKAGKPKRRIATLEKLSLLLPGTGLWRARYANDYKSVRQMEKSAKVAASLVAAWHYERGIASGNPKSFEVAESFYSILIESDSTSIESNKWRIRQGHSNYFSGRLGAAARIYSDLKENFKISRATLAIAGYQLVLTREKIWRKAFSQAFEGGDDVKSDQRAQAAAHELNQAIDEYANRFPNQSRSVDVMLIGASAYRDQGLFEFASKLWQRVLISKPTTYQRSTAIRGLLFASMKEGAASDVIASVRRFLKLENWKSLGPALRVELLGVLAQAVREEGVRLSQSGHILKAGDLLLDVAIEFPSMPDRSTVYRDGSYSLALAGKWDRAGAAADKYIAANSKKLRGDMLYLSARASEFRLRFGLASEGYRKLADEFPNHRRSKTGLERAEKLSLAENDFAGAAIATSMLGDIEKNHRKKLASYSRSYEHYRQSDAHAKSVIVGRRRLVSSKSVLEKLDSRLMIAVAGFSAGAEVSALSEYSRVSKNATQNKNVIGKRNWARLVGESQFRLGREAQEKFDGFQISERSGSIQSRISTKAKYFAEMTNAYELAGRTNHPKWSSMSRYYLAKSAGDFADEIAGMAKRRRGDLSPNERRQYRSQVKRLREVSRKFHNRNLAVKSNSPSTYYQNRWVRKSSIELSGYEFDKKNVEEYSEQIPSAIHLDLPNQWTL